MDVVLKCCDFGIINNILQQKASVIEVIIQALGETAIGYSTILP